MDAFVSVKSLAFKNSLISWTKLATLRTCPSSPRPGARARLVDKHRNHYAGLATALGIRRLIDVRPLCAPAAARMSSQSNAD